MEKQKTRQFLDQQLEWCKEQDRILEKIETTLYEMKAIAEYAATSNLDPFETEKLNAELNQLKREVASLQTQLHPSEITH